MFGLSAFQQIVLLAVFLAAVYLLGRAIREVARRLR